MLFWLRNLLNLVKMKVVTIIGARPQFVKAAVVSRVLAEAQCVEEVIVHTGSILMRI